MTFEECEDEWNPFADPAVAAAAAAESEDLIFGLDNAANASSSNRIMEMNHKPLLKGDGGVVQQAIHSSKSCWFSSGKPANSNDNNNNNNELEELEAVYAMQLLQSIPSSQKLQLVQEQQYLSEVGSGELQTSVTVDNTDAIIRAAPDPIDIEGFCVDADYEGPVYWSGSISIDFCNQLLQWQKDRKILAKKYAYALVLDIIPLLKDVACTVVDVDVADANEITVCGDVHGQYYDLLHIWEINGMPSEDNPYLFNGDFVDRGPWSCEVILLLFAWKLLLPHHFHLARGNHESRAMNHIYGFEGEVRQKYDPGLYSLFCEAFCFLPLCHVINRQVFVVHGGLFSQDDVSLEELRRVYRVCEPPDQGLMVEMLWSDPQPVLGRTPSKRGVGVSFGEDVTQNFLSTNALKLVIRSHELCGEGYSIGHSGKLITVFSAPNYCDQMGNKGAFIRLDGATVTPRPHSFEAVEHPPLAAMHYANPLGLASIW